MTADAATVALLADNVADVEPPAGVRAALLAQIAASAFHRRAGRRRDGALEKSGPSCAPGGSPCRRRRIRARASAAAPLGRAILVRPGGFARPSSWGRLGCGVRRRTAQQRRHRSSRSTRSRPLPDAQSETVTMSDGGESTAHWSESVGKAVLVTDGLPTLADDESSNCGSCATALDLGRHLHRRRRHCDGAAGRCRGAWRRDCGHRRGGRRVAHGQPTSDPIVAISTRTSVAIRADAVSLAP